MRNYKYERNVFFRSKLEMKIDSRHSIPDNASNKILNTLISVGKVIIVCGDMNSFIWSDSNILETSIETWTQTILSVYIARNNIPCFTFTRTIIINDAFHKEYIQSLRSPLLIKYSCRNITSIRSNILTWFKMSQLCQDVHKWTSKVC